MLTTPSRTVDRAAPSWSPSGKLLAYHEGSPVGSGSPASYVGLGVIVRRVTAGHDPIEMRVRFPRSGGVNDFAFGEDQPSIAWAPGGRKVATIIGFTASGAPGTPGYSAPVIVGLADVPSGRTHTITVRFPSWIAHKAPAIKGVVFGSYPAGDELAWSANGRQLLFITRGLGEGSGLTGVWRVSSRGGMAHLLLGTPADIHERRFPSAPVDSARMFSLSPDHRRLATDPNEAFWTSGSNAGRGMLTKVPIPARQACFLMQWSWLPDSSGFAYVVGCLHELYRFSLYSVQPGETPRLLLSFSAKADDALALGPELRGGGY